MRAFYSDRGAAHENEPVTLHAVVRNDCSQIGTVYVRFLAAESYNLTAPLFDSDRDLSSNERQALRLVDISPGEERPVACSFIVPSGVLGRHFDIQVEVWNPQRLFRADGAWKFADTGWRGMFEVIAKPVAELSDSVFVSYSWDSEPHKDWVRQLAEELERHNIRVLLDQKDLQPGEDVTLFMERGISESKVTVLVCTEAYTRKANARDPGGVGFETVISSHEYFTRSPAERSRFIPVVRNNELPSGRKLPRYLGSALYIEMSNADWRSQPFLQLVGTIKRHVRRT